MQQPDVIVIGADLRGTAAACELAQAGARVLVVDPLKVAGGEIQRFRLGSDEIQTGAHALLGRAALDRVFAACRRRVEDYVALRRVEPLLKIFFADGVVLDVQRLDAMVRQLDQQFPHTRPGAAFRDAVLNPDAKREVDAARVQMHVERMRAELEFPGRCLVEGLFNSEAGLVAVSHALERLACELGVQWRFATRVLEIRPNFQHGVEVRTEREVLHTRQVVVSPRTVPEFPLFIWHLSRPYEHLAENNILLGLTEGAQIQVRASRGGKCLTVTPSSNGTAPRDIDLARRQIVELMNLYGMGDCEHRILAERVVQPTAAAGVFGEVGGFPHAGSAGTHTFSGGETDLDQVPEVVRVVLSSLQSG